MCVGTLARGAPEPRGAEVKCAFDLPPVVVLVSRLRVFSIWPPLHAERGSGVRGMTGDAHAARGARGARASRVVNHRRSRAGVSRRAAVLFSSSVLLSSCPSLRVCRSLAPPARRRACAPRASARTHAECDAAHVWVCCQCAEARAFARVGAAVVVHRDRGREPPTHRPTDPPRRSTATSQRPLRRGLASLTKDRRPPSVFFSWCPLVFMLFKETKNKKRKEMNKGRRRRRRIAQ